MRSLYIKLYRFEYGSSWSNWEIDGWGKQICLVEPISAEYITLGQADSQNIRHIALAIGNDILIQPRQVVPYTILVQLTCKAAGKYILHHYTNQIKEASLINYMAQTDEIMRERIEKAINLWDEIGNEGSRTIRQTLSG